VTDAVVLETNDTSGEQDKVTMNVVEVSQVKEGK